MIEALYWLLLIVGVWTLVAGLAALLWSWLKPMRKSHERYQRDLRRRLWERDKASLPPQREPAPLSMAGSRAPYREVYDDFAVEWNRRLSG